jgi:hypothetical protein
MESYGNGCGALFQDGIKECIMPTNAAAKVAKTEHGVVAAKHVRA